MLGATLRGMNFPTSEMTSGFNDVLTLKQVADEFARQRPELADRLVRYGEHFVYLLPVGDGRSVVTGKMSVGRLSGWTCAAPDAENEEEARALLGRPIPEVVEAALAHHDRLANFSARRWGAETQTLAADRLRWKRRDGGRVR